MVGFVGLYLYDKLRSVEGRAAEEGEEKKVIATFKTFCTAHIYSDELVVAVVMMLDVTQVVLSGDLWDLLKLRGRLQHEPPEPQQLQMYMN